MPASTPSLPSRFGRNQWQPAATVLACFRRFRSVRICHGLPPVAPARLHKRSILAAGIPDQKPDSTGSGVSSRRPTRFSVGRESGVTWLIKHAVGTGGASRALRRSGFGGGGPRRCRETRATGALRTGRAGGAHGAAARSGSATGRPRTAGPARRVSPMRATSRSHLRARRRPRRAASLPAGRDRRRRAGRGVHGRASLNQGHAVVVTA